MKRFLTLALVGVLALGLTSTAYATYCANDVVPASTLLFPFVQYDYVAGDDVGIDAGNAGATTLFAITNVSNKAQIVHVTLWTDYSIAILDFNIVLTGYDVQTMNIRDILRDGIIPFEEGTTVGDFTGNANIWAEDNQGDTPVDLGPFSGNNQLHGSAITLWFAASPIGNGLPDPEATWDGNQFGLLDCDPTWDASPNNYQAVLPIDDGTLANFRNFLEASMTADTWYANCVPFGASGWPTVANPLDVIDPDDFDPNLDEPWFTAGYEHPAWMYITADVVAACNKDLPDGDALLYFGAVTGITYDDVLMGDMFWLNPGDAVGDANFSEGDNAVHLEALLQIDMEPPLGEGITIGTDDDNGDATTFYSRYHSATSDPGIHDGREPLGTAWAFRYFHAPFADDVAATSIRTWKGSTNQSLVQDLNNGSYSVGPDELYANSCTPYTYYAWDEDENVVGVTGGFIPPWSGEDPSPLPQPNLFPLETQEVDARQFYLVGDDDLAFGWMMFIWPRSNTNDPFGVVGIPSDQYQTWMGVKYQAFGTSSAAFGALQIANWNCDDFSGAMPFPLLNRISYSE
jgi:hypothetical protein